MCWTERINTLILIYAAYLIFSNREKYFRYFLLISSLRSSNHSRMCNKGYTSCYTYYGYIKQVNMCCSCVRISTYHSKHVRTYYTLLLYLHLTHSCLIPCLSTADIPLTIVHSCQQKSIGLKFSKSQTGSDVRYSCHHNSSRFLSPYLRIRAVSLSSIHYNQSHRVYINRRRQYICLI